MNFINVNKKTKYLLTLAMAFFVLGLGGLWFKAFNISLSISFIFFGIVIYGYCIKIAFNALLSGGKDRLLELIKSNVKDKEFLALESLYLLVKPISLRLPDEVGSYKLSQLLDKEKEYIKN